MAQYDINLREYWRILKKRKIVVILVAVVLGLFSTVFAILRAPDPLYSTTCVVKFEKQNTLEGLFGVTISWSQPQDIGTQVSVIKSYSVFQRVAEKLRLIPPGSRRAAAKLDDNIIALIENLQARVEVTKEPFTNILNITVTDKNPVFAQKLANAIAETYKEWHAEEQIKQTREALRYIDDQLRAVRKKLREAEDAFNTFSQENELVSIDLQSENLLARAQEMRDQIRKLQQDKEELQEIHTRLNQFVENPSLGGHDFYSAKADSQYQSTYEKLLELLLKRDTLLKDFTAKHPDVLAVSYQIMETAQKMRILLQLQIAGTDKRIVDLTNALASVDRKTKVLMDKKLEYDRLRRRVESYNEMAALLERKNQEALIRKAERPEGVTIVKPALLPTAPINPPKTVATGVIGVMIGLVLGLVIGFLVETFDTSLGAIEDVEETLGTQVLGIIPQADVKAMMENLKAKHPKGISLPDETRMGYLLSHFVPRSMMAESFRGLRTNIQFKDAGKKIKSVAITSSSPQEGKTMVAINLAIAMAQARMKVLLVGSDLRKPALDRVFDVEMAPGLTDILMGNYHWRDTVKTVMDMVMGKLTQTQIIRTPGLDNLHIITSGPIPPNPTELIDSRPLTDMIEEAKEIYDVIIFDSPPILSTADAAILAAKVDGVLLVYRVGAVSRGLLKRCAAQLEQVESNMLGVVLNGMRPEVSPDFQDYKHYTYYYAYDEEGKEKRAGRPRRKKRERMQSLAPADAPKAPDKGGLKGSRMGRLVLMLVAISFLVGGILWQSGFIDPFEASQAPGPEEKGPPKGKDLQGKFKTSPPANSPASKAATGRDREWNPTRKSAAPKGALSGVLERGDTRQKHSESGGKQGPEIRARDGRPSELAADYPGAEGPESQKVMSGPTQDKPERGPSSGQERVTTESKEAHDFGIVLGKSRAEAKMASDEDGAHSAENRASYPYSIRLGAFRTLKRAKDAVSLYRMKGLSAHWVKVVLNNETWYRVYTGHFETRGQAEQAKKVYGLTEAVVKKTLYANQVGIPRSSSSGEIDEQIQRLEEIGYSPYTIKYSNGRERLFVGAFMTRKGAEMQHQELISNGVQNRIIKR